MVTDIIVQALRKIINALETGNSKIDHDDAVKIIEYANNLTNQNRELSTDEVIRELNVSRNYFYDHIKPNLKGIKRPGQKTILYTVKEINKFKNTFQKAINQ